MGKIRKMRSYSQEYRLWEKLGKCVRILGSIDYGKNSENALVTPFHKLLTKVQFINEYHRSVNNSTH